MTFSSWPPTPYQNEISTGACAAAGVARSKSTDARRHNAVPAMRSPSLGCRLRIIPDRRTSGVGQKGLHISLHAAHTRFARSPHTSSKIHFGRREVTAMKLGTLRRLVPVLLLLGAITVSMTACVLVPIPVGGGGGGHHGRSQRW